MTADFPDDPIIENNRVVSYRFGHNPTNMVATACAQHAQYLNWDVPADPYQGRPGYLTPPQNPTPAEKLYMYLYRFTAQNTKIKDSCKCVIAEYADRFDADSLTIHQHPHHTKKCPHHLNDDDQHTTARNEHKKLVDVKEAMKASTDLTKTTMQDNGIPLVEWKEDFEPLVQYTEARELTVKLPSSLSVAKRNAIINLVNSKYSGVTFI